MSILKDNQYKRYTYICYTYTDMRYETPHGINQETALTKSALKWL